MKRESKINGFLLCIFVTILFLAGCVRFLGQSIKQGTPIKEDMVKMIQPGKTTKEDIIQWFGIPNVIQKQGEETASPKQVDMVQPFVSPVFPSFDFFSSKHKITEDHRIYAYFFTKTEGTMTDILIFSKQYMTTLTDTLLVLVNEKIGIAEDYIFRKENK
jgi:hypothetical protein